MTERLRAAGRKIERCKLSKNTRITEVIAANPQLMAKASSLAPFSSQVASVLAAEGSWSAAGLILPLVVSGGWEMRGGLVAASVGRLNLAQSLQLCPGPAGRAQRFSATDFRAAIALFQRKQHCIPLDRMKTLRLKLEPLGSVGIRSFDLLVAAGYRVRVTAPPQLEETAIIGKPASFEIKSTFPRLRPAGASLSSAAVLISALKPVLSGALGKHTSDWAQFPPTWVAKAHVPVKAAAALELGFENRFERLGPEVKDGANITRGGVEPVAAGVEMSLDAARTSAYATTLAPVSATEILTESEIAAFAPQPRPSVAPEFVPMEVKPVIAGRAGNFGAPPATGVRLELAARDCRREAEKPLAFLQGASNPRIPDFVSAAAPIGLYQSGGLEDGPGPRVRIGMPRRTRQTFSFLHGSLAPRQGTLGLTALQYRPGLANIVKTAASSVQPLSARFAKPRRTQTLAHETLVPLKPRLRLRAIDVLPSSIEQQKPVEMELASSYWQTIPARTKRMMLVLPALAALIALAVNLGEERIQIASLRPESLSLPKGPLASGWAAFRRELSERARVNATDDFSSGFNDWKFNDEKKAGWSIAKSGGATVGELALYEPSLALADYRFEFTGQIDKKGLGFAVRAADPRNYYAVKLVVVKSGLMPTVAIVRYPVINGKEGKHTQVPLTMPVSADQVYHVEVIADQSAFALSVQGQVMDTWNDETLQKGGVGFFTAKGEQARVQMIRITHQDDMVGKLCSYLMAR